MSPSGRWVGTGGVGGAWNYLRSSYLCVGQKTVPKEESGVEILCLGVLRVLGVLLGLWRENVGRALPRSLKAPNVLQIGDLTLQGEGRQEM